MKYIDEFRDRKLIEIIARKIYASVEPGRKYNFMEVCGTHTMAIFRFGLKELLPDSIRLISGPGCPVCVTPNQVLDKAIALSRHKDVIITTFGDMMRVPGSYSSLAKEKARGASIKIVYSTEDALALAMSRPDKEIVFLGIGFETTAPTVAQSIVEAGRKGIRNYSVLSAHKTMPEALKLLVKKDRLNIDGFLLPGHVSAVIGVRPYEFLSRVYRRRCVISGFEPIDIMQSILMLIRQKNPKVEIQYARIINRNGNSAAVGVMKKIFRRVPSSWRGMGRIAGSGLVIRDEYASFDASKKFRLKARPPRENKNCLCGKVIMGLKTPPECGLFAGLCRPEKPVGACMVSSEGACAAYYKYRGTGGGNG